MLTFPDDDPKMPIKFNLLWLIVNNGPMDIDGFYIALLEMRKDMPHNEHKYTKIRRGLEQLEREGWPIHKQLANGVAWYGIGKGFNRFLLERLKEYIDDALIRHDKVQRYAARPDVQARYLKKMNPSKKLMVKYPEVTIEDGQWAVPLKLVPHFLEPLKKK